jgi:hypothetical protein
MIFLRFWNLPLEVQLEYASLNAPVSVHDSTLTENSSVYGKPKEVCR